MTDIVERLKFIAIDNAETLTEDEHATLSEAAAILSEAEKREREARTGWVFAEGDQVRKKSGSWWEGRVVGRYSTEQTPRGYAVQLDKPFGPVQIYPESALESALQSEER
ncbi:hypothetical protein JZX88_05905 [Agrobacterium sp. OT33]|nr:hypothetical protein [Agrobacterium sp. OT33]